MQAFPDALPIAPKLPVDADVRVPGSKSLTNRALVVAALSVAVALVLMIGLQTVALPLVAVAFDALCILATFGAMTLLFGGDDPLLGGPGYLDPMSIIGIFAAIFGIVLIILGLTGRADPIAI